MVFTFYTRCCEYRIVEQMAFAHSSPRVLTFLRILSLFLSLSLSLTHSFTQTCLSSFAWCLSFLSPSFFRSFFPIASPLILFSVQSPFLFIHVSEDESRSALARARERERERERILHSSSTTNLPNRDLTYSQRRTATSLLAFTTDMSYHSKFANKNTHHRHKLGGPR